MGMPVEPVYDHGAYRARTNDPDPSGVDAAFDAGDVAQDTPWTQDVDTLIRVRMRVDQTEATAVNNVNMATEFLLQYENNTADPGTWNDVGAVGGDVEDVQYIAATGFANGDNTTTARIGATSLVTGDGREVAGATDTVTFTEEAVSQTELEFSIEIVGSLVTDGDVINLRLLHSDGDEAPPATVLDAETSLPQMTANVPDTTDEDWVATQPQTQEPVRRVTRMVAHD